MDVNFVGRLFSNPYYIVLCFICMNNMILSGKDYVSNLMKKKNKFLWGGFRRRMYFLISIVGKRRNKKYSEQV